MLMSRMLTKTVYSFGLWFQCMVDLLCKNVSLDLCGH